MNIEKIAHDILFKIIRVIKKEENMKQVHKELISPLVNYTYKKIYPYIILVFCLLILTFVIIIIILLLILKLYLKKKIK